MERELRYVFLLLLYLISFFLFIFFLKWGSLAAYFISQMKATHALVLATEYEWRKAKLFAYKSWLPEGECVWRSELTEELHPKACVLIMRTLRSLNKPMGRPLSISHLSLWLCPHLQKNRCLFTARQHCGVFVWFFFGLEWMKPWISHK